MTKTMTTLEVRNMAGPLFQAWEENKREIKLSGRNLHSLLTIKKSLESHLIIIEETIAGLAMQFGGVPQENGAITIPPDSREAANKALAEYSRETVSVEAPEISLSEKDYIPIEIYEGIFDFVSFSDGEKEA